MEIDNDDATIGRILTRREVIALLGAAGAGAAVAGVAAQSFFEPAASTAPGSIWLPACVVTPAQQEGPYFVDEKLNRIDIRTDPGTKKVSAGAQLDFEVRVYRVAKGACEPLAGAMVDIWQCDALGLYAGVKDINGLFTTTGQKFLRGYQMTDAKGVAKFTTVYPGWYQGRAVHVHFKVRTKSGARDLDFTSQLYFDDALTDKVHAKAPYVGKAGTRRRNEADGIFAKENGKQLIMPVTEQGAGYRGTFDIGMTM